MVKTHTRPEQSEEYYHLFCHMTTIVMTFLSSFNNNKQKYAENYLTYDHVINYRMTKYVDITVIQDIITPYITIICF